jgi:hypothetical protein
MTNGSQMIRSIRLRKENSCSLDFSELIDAIEQAERHASASLKTSQSHREELIEQNKKNMKPVDASFKVVKKHIEYEDDILKSNVNLTTILADATESALDELATQIPEKQQEIITHDEDLKLKQEPVRELQTRTGVAQTDREFQLADAERLRKVRDGFLFSPYQYLSNPRGSTKL